MNFLIISPNSPFISVGGVERYIKNLIEFCEHAPGHFYFVLPSPGKDKVLRRGNATILFKESLTMGQRSRKGANISSSARSRVKEKAQDFFDFLNAFIDEKQIDAVIANNFHLGLPPVFSLLTNMACNAKNVPIFLQLHSFAANDLQAELINGLFWEKTLCVSKSVAGDTFQKGADIKNLTTKYLGVNTEEFNPGVDTKWLKKKLKLDPTDKVILCASRILQGYKDILQQKGIIDLLDAFSKIAPRDPSMKLVIAMGKPPAELETHFEDAKSKLEGFVQIHGIEDQVILKTFVLEEMPRVYAGSDVFVLASENETFGQVFIEAMACGLPVIGTKVGGIPEIISNQYNGYLVVPNDPSVLADKIMTLLHDQKVRQTLIANGLKTVTQKFDTKTLFEDYFEYLSKYATIRT